MDGSSLGLCPWWNLMSCNTELFHSGTRGFLHIIITLPGIHVKLSNDECII